MLRKGLAGGVESGESSFESGLLCYFRGDTMRKALFSAISKVPVLNSSLRVVTAFGLGNTLLF
jgi:hypothetical protein